MTASATTRPCVPVVHGVSVLTVLQDFGFCRDEILQPIGLSSDLFSDATKLLTAPEHLRLILRGVQMIGPRLGYELGLRGQPTKHGNLGFGMLSCATLGDALRFFIRYQTTRSPFFSYALYQNDSIYRLTVDSGAFWQAQLRQVGMEAILSEIYHVAIALTGRAELDLALHFDFAQPDYFADYAARFHRVAYCQQETYLSFPADVLSLPLPGANPLMVQQCEQRCDEELAQGLGDMSLPDMLRVMLKPTGSKPPSMAKLAGRLNMSERTLSRRLDAAGLSFRKLREEALMRQAEILLQKPDMPIQEIAMRLGYSDTAHFTRAFKIRYTTTPSAYRKQQHNS